MACYVMAEVGRSKRRKCTDCVIKRNELIIVKDNNVWALFGHFELCNIAVL